MAYGVIKRLSTVMLGTFVGILVVLFGAMSSTPVFAYSATLTTNSDVVINVSAADTGTAIHPESINVTSDCRNGYNLSVATPEGSDLYKYTNNVASNTATFTAVDGTSMLWDLNNVNKWGFSMANNPDVTTVFSPLSATPSVLKTSAQTASPNANINDTFNINYGIQVDSTVEPGNYRMANNGAVVYYLTMDVSCTQYTISFNPNGGTGTTTTQNIQEGQATKLSSADMFTAPATTNYTDAGNNTITGVADKRWTFWGWNTAIDGTASGPISHTTSNFYGSTTSVTATLSSGRSLTIAN